MYCEELASGLAGQEVELEFNLVSIFIVRWAPKVFSTLTLIQTVQISEISIILLWKGLCHLGGQN